MGIGALVVTTDSRHNLPVYPNLAGEMKPTAINQLWVADISYIRLRTEFESSPQFCKALQHGGILHSWYDFSGLF